MPDDAVPGPEAKMGPRPTVGPMPMSGAVPLRPASEPGAGPDEPPALAIEGLSFSYPDADAPVLRDLSLTLEPGAFALLVGDTGSGKSTLLSLVKPEIAPAGERAGAVRVLGRRVEELDASSSAQLIGYVFQNPDNQIVCESVWHEMAFGLENLGAPQDEMRRRVAETSYFFGMEDWFRRDTDSLSGGRKQLLALASALVMRPRLLLLDEPTAQLDPITEKTFLHALFRVNRELGCTVVVATHRPRAMAEYATCAFRLAGGRVEPVGLAELGGRQPLADAGGSTGPTARTGDRHDPAPTAVGLAGAWFRYGRDEDWVLRGLDLDIDQGEIHALVGGNGCGKSTLLSLMAGARALQRGRLRVAEPRARALLPQDPRALFAEESVETELMEWASIRGYGATEAAEMIGRLGLPGEASRRHPYDLSGGQQQLLALGKLLLVRPRLLLLDEPTKGLDDRARIQVAGLLRAERAKGVTIVMATHDLAFARDVADRVSMVFDGEVACTEPAPAFFADNLYYRP